MNLSITITKPLLLHPERMREATVGAMHEGTALLEKEISQRAPVGVGGEAGLKGSIYGEVKEFGTFVLAQVATPLSYAEVVEYGRSANRAMPPVSALIPWVEKKLTLKKGQTAEGVAWAVARYMAQRGSRAWRSSPPGERMFLRGFEKAAPMIESLFLRRCAAALVLTME